MEVVKVRIVEIEAGNPIRKDIGDLSALRESMSTEGQRQPISLVAGDVLLFGSRRLESAKRLGWDTVDAVRLENADQAVQRIYADRNCGLCEIPLAPVEILEFVERVERAFAERGWVYFVNAEGLRLIKIGWTSNIDRRMSQLIGASPVPLNLLDKWPGTRFDEADFHKRWEHLRKHGEWFRAEAELVRWIARKGDVRDGN